MYDVWCIQLQKITFVHIVFYQFHSIIRYEIYMYPAQQYFLLIKYTNMTQKYVEKNSKVYLFLHLFS